MGRVSPGNGSQLGCFDATIGEHNVVAPRPGMLEILVTRNGHVGQEDGHHARTTALANTRAAAEKASTLQHLQVPPRRHPHRVKTLPLTNRPYLAREPNGILTTSATTSHPTGQHIARRLSFLGPSQIEWNSLPQQVTTAPTPGSFRVVTRSCSLLDL